MVVKSEENNINKKCSYNLNGSVLQCAKLEKKSDIENLPPEAQNSVKSLIFNNCNYFLINSNLNLKNIKSISINNSSIEIDDESIDLSQFNNLEDFQIIFSQKELRVSISTNWDLPNLKKLTLISDKIEEINFHYHDNLSGLKILTLKNNKIKSIPSHCFESLINLEKLDLSFNQINLIDKNSFIGLTELTVLNLQNNNLKLIDPNSFNYLVKLEEFYLNYNEIEEILEGSFNLNKLKFFSLAANKLTEISDKLFINCSELLSISLEKNRLNNNLSPEPFIMLKNLKHLTLTGNNLSRVNFDNNVKFAEQVLLTF